MSNPTIPEAKIIACSHGRSYGSAAKVIEAAGRTCYKSFDKITDDSAEKFVAMVLRLGHESVIEHSWLVFQITKERLIANGEGYLLQLLMKNRFFSLTERNDSFILSGNARMFRNYFKSLKNFSGLDAALLFLLKQTEPIIFSDLALPEMEVNVAGVVISPEIEYLPEEKLKHFWCAIRFQGGSRAFTHQLVRHRPTAISQESQRYCDEAGFTANNYFVVPGAIKKANMSNWYEDKMKQIDAWYMELQNIKNENGQRLIPNEDARFLLPNAVCSEIVMSANLEEWRWIFKMRCNLHAQWEIRHLALKALMQLQEIYPDCFDDFKICAELNNK